MWSGGAFCYIPKGVKCDLPLQSYFRMEGAGEGTFEHTLIVADEGSEVNYIEGCTAQTYSVNSMHSAVVEIFVHEGAKARYTTVQNWSKDVYNLNTKRADRRRRAEPSSGSGLDGRQVRDALPGLVPDGRGRARRPPQRRRRRQGVHKDTGAKVVHLAPNTTSNILAKSISKDGGIMGYRGLVKMGQLAGLEVPRPVRRADDGRRIEIGHLARHPDPEPARDGRPRGDRRDASPTTSSSTWARAGSPRTRRRR